MQNTQKEIRIKENTIEKLAKHFSNHFGTGDIPLPNKLANKHIKRGSILLVIKEIQIESTVRYHQYPPHTHTYKTG